MIYEPRGRAAEYSPLAMNIYSGCSHGCVYCYAPAATYTNPKIFHGEPQPRRNFFRDLRKDLQKYRGDRRPILLCFTTDPYQPIDESAKLTRISLKGLIENGNVVKILTKGGTKATRDFDVMREGDCAFGATLTFLDHRRSMEWEPGAATPMDRIAALRQAKSAGISTWVSLEPVIDPEAAYDIIKETHEFVDLYKVGKLNYHPRAKEICWRSFGINVRSLLESLGKRYYLKKDLEKFTQ